MFVAECIVDTDLLKPVAQPDRCPLKYHYILSCKTSLAFTSTSDSSNCFVFGISVFGIFVPKLPLFYKVDHPAIDDQPGAYYKAGIIRGKEGSYFGNFAYRLNGRLVSGWLMLL